ncbi:PAS domain-containing protein [Hydrogenophaga taeniospiralis]|uniref:PAS domain-containing protein n=1 Tax=Hydrogenophaga taeniospiralis TaxID=65656 RepID=UPI001CFB2647|nr:PAS domain-containing protein [Hydrogenophaga taeniospiralis]UCU92268.1 PAS domain-containing protein [Hydrogenophaga taeniospiralis]
MNTDHTEPKSSQGALRVVLAYAVFAGLWILLSDRAMGLLFSEPEALVQASMAKGWFFVAVTTLLLFVLVGRLVNQLNASHLRERAEAEEKRRAMQLLAAIAESSSDAIFANDQQGRYLLVNNAAARYMGKPKEALLGHDARVAFPAEQAALIMTIDRRVFASGQVETNEERLSTAQGERVFLATRGPLRDVHGKTFGSFGISRDITERMAAQAMLERRNAELERFDRASVGRELEMINMKKAINAMSRELGRDPPYRLDFLADVETQA